MAIGKKQAPDYDWLLFLKQDTQEWKKRVISLVYEKEYPASFISLYIAQKKDEILTIDTVGFDDPITTILQALSTTFLGKTYTYVVKTALEDFSKQDQHILLAFLRNYSGPHYVVVLHISTLTVGATHYTIQVPSMLNIEQSLVLALFCNAPLPAVKKIITQIASDSQMIPFGTIVMICQYAQLISSGMMEDFIVHIIPKLFLPKQSLFELSKKFFSKDRSFFAFWHTVESSYSLQFWIVFWADQLSKAALFCKYKRTHNFNEAKIVGHGLPFSFLQKDWQLYDPHILVDTYESLYTFDVQYKEGAIIKSLDPWFIIFFRQQSH